MSELVERVTDAREKLRRDGWEPDTVFLPQREVDRLSFEAGTVKTFPKQDRVQVHGLDVLNFDVDDYGLVVDNNAVRGGVVVYPEAIRPIEVDP